MFRIARNEAVRAAGRRRRTNERPLATDELFANIDRHCGQTDDAEVVAAALAQLDADDRELVELKIFGDLTFREVAEVVGRPQATVATQYRRALESLRHWLTQQYK
jgi:RNA polymerase sigma-70 factor (ECF subfamily)